jgi:DNA-binding response OmpR family regulator
MTDPINKRKPKILISEDDYENKIFLEVLLKQYFEVYICDSAESFYYYLNEGPIDAILMDISIYGDKNGLQLTREIKSSPLYKQIPVICYTAHARQQDRINAFDAGCDFYLAKPVENDILINTLLEAANRSVVQ